MSDQSDDSNPGTTTKSRSYTATDVQKVRLEKLFANIDKPVVIPERKGDKKKSLNPPEFVRNVMGSSAGAGSGEFHVYRHLRRKEFARLHQIDFQARNEQLDVDYQKRLEENRKLAEEATEKKRAKRQRKKEKLKAKKKAKPNAVEESSEKNSEQANQASNNNSSDDEESKESSP